MNRQMIENEPCPKCGGKFKTIKEHKRLHVIKPFKEIDWWFDVTKKCSCCGFKEDGWRFANPSEGYIDSCPC